MDQLSSSERAVLDLAVRGWTTKAIAEFRQTSPQTVKNQFTSIFLKLGVTNRVQACVVATKHEIRKERGDA